jgi:hypothetical protein
MASVTITPADAQVGDQVAISGEGFLADSVVTVSILEYGESFETVSDAAGDISSDDLPDRAIATLTSNGTDVSVNDTVTIGAVTYTFKAAPTTVANEVKIGGTAAASLANLKKAINLTGVSGTDYGSSTVIHPTVAAGALTATTLRLYAKTGGTAGNTLASTEVAVTLSFGDTTFVDLGAASTGVSPMLFTPTHVGPLTARATDGTNSAEARILVYSQ